MYTNANFWRDMAILAGSWLMAGWGAWQWSQNQGVTSGCPADGWTCE